MSKINFTAEDAEAIKKMARSGKSYTDIARRFKVTKNFIYQWLKKNGIQRGEVKVTEGLYSQRETCNGCGYRGYRGGCNYILVTGKPRGCPASNCTQYIPVAELKKTRKGDDDDDLPILDDDMTDEQLIKYVEEKEAM